VEREYREGTNLANFQVVFDQFALKNLHVEKAVLGGLPCQLQKI
jgi:hypothetical protein